MLAPVPRRYSPLGFVELRTRLEGDRASLEPGGLSLRFFASQFILMLVFLTIGGSLAYFVRHAGVLISIAMLAIALIGWAPVALILAAAALNARAGGPLCIYDRSTGSFEAPREGIRLEKTAVEEVCFLKFYFFSMSSHHASATSSSQVLVQVRDAAGERRVIPLAVSCRPAAAARRFARSCGAEFTKGSARSQDQQLWEQAPDWTFPRPIASPGK